MSVPVHLYGSLRFCSLLISFEDAPQLGRFTLRDEGRTIAIGKITKVLSAEDMPDVARLNIDGEPVAQ